MALSNWDTLALDCAAEPCSGTISKTYPDGNIAGVEIYKNWLYVRDTAMWTEDRPFVTPTIAEVTKGEVVISGFRIYADRGPQNSVLCFVETGYKHSKEEKYKYDCMCGIGCYGYDGDAWAGVKQPTFAALLGFLGGLMNEHIVDKEYFKKVKNSKPLRFNQGDGYFAFNLKEPNAIQATKIGEPRQPLIMQMMQDVKEGGQDEKDSI